METTYERPVTATLHVHLDNGESWEATPEDLERFNLVDRHAAYMRFDEALTRALSDAGLLDSGDITDACLNPLRYLVETAIVHPQLLNHREHDGWVRVADVESVLQEHRRANEESEASAS